MTVICAIRSGYAYAIAADGMATGGSFVYTRNYRKISRIGNDIVLAFTGSMRLHQDMIKLVDKYVDDRNVSMLPEAEVIDEIVERSRALFKEQSKPSEEDGPPCFGSHYLLGVRGCLVEVSQDLSYEYVTDDEPIVAIGSGCDFAIGAATGFGLMAEGLNIGRGIQTKAVNSVRVACWHDSSCGGLGSSILWYDGAFSEITSFDTKLGV